jgi:2-hydroxychromene-2-carboxylate isomerase
MPRINVSVSGIYAERRCKLRRIIMANPIDFYFDFSSPYGYLASTAIDALAARHGRVVRWRPFLIGALYKQLGYMPLEQPGKRAYFRHDVPRSARAMNIALTIPASFPAALIAPARALYWIADQDPAKAAAFGRAAFRAYWAEGRKLADPAVVAEIAAAHGFAKEAVLAALADQAVKDRLKAETDAAIAAGIFGSPFIVIDGERFWGSDRLDQIEKWLATGGW